MAKIAKIRVGYMARWSRIANSASERGFSKDDVKSDLDRVLVEMMREAMKWKRECGMEGDNEVRINQCGKVTCGDTYQAL